MTIPPICSFLGCGNHARPGGAFCDAHLVHDERAELRRVLLLVSGVCARLQLYTESGAMVGPRGCDELEDDLRDAVDLLKAVLGLADDKESA